MKVRVIIFTIIIVTISSYSQSVKWLYTITGQNEYGTNIIQITLNVDGSEYVIQNVIGTAKTIKRSDYTINRIPNIAITACRTEYVEQGWIYWVIKDDYRLTVFRQEFWLDEYGQEKEADPETLINIVL